MYFFNDPRKINLDKVDPTKKDEVMELLNSYHDKMKRIRDCYDNGEILKGNRFIDETEQIVLRIEELTGEFSTELVK